jgi:hypothetical protein
MTVPLPTLNTPLTRSERAQRAERFRQQMLHAGGQHPFTGIDTTVGVENEFQVAVEGKRSDVDLPITVVESNYYRNLTLRARRGDLSPHLLNELNAFLDDQQNRIWENSWVRFPRRLVGEYAASVLNRDLLADKANPNGPTRQDSSRFSLLPRRRALAADPGQLSAETLAGRRHRSA